MNVLNRTPLSNRVFAIFIAAIMVISMLPFGAITAFAEGTISVGFKITDSSANDIQGAKVTVDGKTADTDSNGEAVISGLNAGENYSYTVTKVGYEDGSGSFEASESVTVEVTLTMLETVTVRGSVTTGEITPVPVDDAVVKVSGYCDYNTTTDAEGKFEIIGVYSGKSYTVQVSKPGYITVLTNLILDDSNDIVLKEKSNEELAFEYESLEIHYGETGYNVASSTSGQADRYESANTDIATVDNFGKVTPTGIGTTVITAYKDATDTTNPSEASYNLTVLKGTQAELVWTMSIPDDLNWQGSFTNTVAGGSGDGVITYTSNNLAVANVNSSTGELEIFKPGTVRITAIKDGGSLYEDVTAFYDITIIKCDQAPLVFETTHPEAIYYGDNSFSNAASGGSIPEGTIQYSSSDTSVVTVDSNGRLTTHKSGEGIIITASLEGNEYYNDVSASYSITVYRADQTTDFVFALGNGPHSITYGEDFCNPAQGSESGVVTYNSSDTAIATVDEEGNVTAIKAGIVTITATSAANDMFEEASISYELTIELAENVVIFEHGSSIIPAITYGNAFSNSATASTSNITYTSGDRSIADVDQNGKLIIYKAGVVTITATAAEDDCYHEGSASYTITINKAAQTIEFENGSEPNIVFNSNGNIYINPASSNATASGEMDIIIEYSIESGENYVDSINAETGELHIVEAGIVVIKVTFGGNDRYNGNTSVYTLTVDKSQQKIEFELFDNDTYSVPKGQKTVMNAAHEVGENYGTGAITYSIVSNESNTDEYFDDSHQGIVKEINEETGEVTLYQDRSGSAVIKATKAEDGNYIAAETIYTLVVTDDFEATETYRIVGASNDGCEPWFVGNVSIEVVDSELYSICLYNEGTDIEDDDWTSVLEDVVVSDTTGTEVSFLIRDNETGNISRVIQETIMKDALLPVASITEIQPSGWERFLTIITFGLWESDTVTLTIESDDLTSGVKSVEYYVAYNSTELLTLEQLDSITEWISGISVEVDKNNVFVTYAKVIDNAGNYVYATTNGIVFDGAVPTVTITPENPAATFEDNGVVVGLYSGDISVQLQAEDQSPYSGVRHVEYWITSNGVETSEHIVLFDFDMPDNPLYSDLIERTETYTITIPAENNNSDNVVLHVSVEDNAGNSETYEQRFAISTDIPVITISYIDDPQVQNTLEGVNYYDSSRTAKIDIQSRNSVFSSSLPVIQVNESGGTTDLGVTYEIINWSTDVNNPDLHTAYIMFNGSASYDYSISYTDKVGHRADDKPYPIEYFVVDNESPTGTISIGEYTWSILLEKLTFGLWRNNTVNVTATFTDITSPIKSVEYYKTDSTTLILRENLEELDPEQWTEFTGLTIDSDERFTVYLKITDYANRYDYISTDGYIVDMSLTSDNIYVEYPAANEYGYYNSDVTVDIIATDDEPNSGIKKVEYWVLCDGEETQRETLYSFEYTRDEGENTNGGSLRIYENGELTYEGVGDIPSYEQLRHQIENSITIDATLNNSDDVKVFIEVTDNAGNVARYCEDGNDYISLKISNTDPVIMVSFDNNAPYTTDEDGRGYFKHRTATVEITSRTTLLNQQNFFDGLVITGYDSDNNPVEITEENVIRTFVETVEGTTPDEAKHTFTIEFLANANYDFTLSYVDNANRTCDYNSVSFAAQTVAPRYFTVDNINPSAIVTVGANTWDRLVEVLTFGLWSNIEYTVSIDPNDATSPVTVDYYKTNGTVVLSEDELETVSWRSYDDEIVIDEDEQFTVYFRVTDYAGNVYYVSTDGHIVDKTNSELTITLQSTDVVSTDGIGIYNGNVDVIIDVEDPEPYSGIKKVEYWVVCDGVETQREVLYSFEYERDEGLNINGGTLRIYEDGELIVEETDHVLTQEELRHNLTKNVIIDSSLNNSSNVVISVAVTDNAGNYKEESKAVDIDIIAPVVRLTYDNNNANKINNGRGYFPAKRIASLEITERTNHFDPEAAIEAISIIAVDSNGDSVNVSLADMTNGLVWSTEESDTPDSAKHTLTIEYEIDANYTFVFDPNNNYADIAGNNYAAPVITADSVTPYEFTIDKVKPNGTVTVEGLGTWDALIEFLTFGLWSRETVHVSGTAEDATSLLEPVEYFKTSDIYAKTESDLRALPESAWTLFNGFDVSPNEYFTVYVRIIDFAGNTKFISTNGVVVDDNAPVVESVAPEITVTPMQPVNEIYNTDVDVAVKVVDPGVDGAYSGIKEIRYEIYNLGIQTQADVLYSFEYGDPDEHPTQPELLSEWEEERAITVDRVKNNSNDVEIRVYAIDNSGNESNASAFIKVDITNPTISVRYDNNDGDRTFADATTDAFFNNTRTATIVITERNFDPNDVVIRITNTDNVIPSIRGWRTEEGTGNGDNTTHTTTILYEADGDYTFDISFNDMVGNPNEPVNYNGSLAPQKFTIDRTAPVVSISYDNNSFLNGNYYDAYRIATITVTEHNFEPSRVVVSLTASEDGLDTDLPTVSDWSSNGNVHTITISYNHDSLYTFDFDYADKAGNSSADVALQSFYIDTTRPVVEISKIVNHSANNDEGNIGFVLKATDDNFDVFEPKLTGVFMTENGFETQEVEGDSVEDIISEGIEGLIVGKIYTVDNIEKDGVYSITCKVVDKAGNEYEQVILVDGEGNTYSEDLSSEDTLVKFSVNRFGSVYELTDEYTKGLLEKYYVQRVSGDVCITEINANELTSYTVKLNDRELVEGDDYSVDLVTDDGSWKVYNYKIFTKLFENEGEYTIVVSSEDEATNTAYSDVKDVKINFVVDRTAPVVAVTGMESDGRYQTENQLVTIVPTDDGGALKSIVVTLVDNNGQRLAELLNLEGEAFETALEAGDGKLTFEIPEGLYQNVRIVCDDQADYDNEENVIFDETFKNISVTSSAFLIYWANKPLRYGTLGGAGAVAVGAGALLVIRKRKQTASK